MKYEQEIGALLAKAERSLDAANILTGSEYYEFSVPRAYYAMFYCSEAMLLARDLRFSKHSAVVASFGKEFVKGGILPKYLHKYLVKALRERQRCDYEVICMPSEEEAEEIIENAEIFLEMTRVYLRKIGYPL
jgi:Uncharacterized conserved protein related to C-terminal domain of eukaryotic chaperone, SACSIN